MLYSLYFRNTNTTLIIVVWSFLFKLFFTEVQYYIMLENKDKLQNIMIVLVIGCQCVRLPPPTGFVAIVGSYVRC